MGKMEDEVKAVVRAHRTGGLVSLEFTVIDNEKCTMVMYEPTKEAWRVRGRQRLSLEKVGKVVRVEMPVEEPKVALTPLQAEAFKALHGCVSATAAELAALVGLPGGAIRMAGVLSSMVEKGVLISTRSGRKSHYSVAY